MPDNKALGILTAEEAEILRQHRLFVDRNKHNNPYNPPLFGLPKLYAGDFRHKYVLLKIASLQQSDSERNILALSRGCWKLDKERAEQADYILSLCKQQIVGVFKAKKWFPAINGIDENRFAFIAESVPQTIHSHYCRKRIISLPHGQNIKAQNPVLYVNC